MKNKKLIWKIVVSIVSILVFLHFLALFIKNIVYLDDIIKFAKTIDDKPLKKQYVEGYILSYTNIILALVTSIILFAIVNLKSLKHLTLSIFVLIKEQREEAKLKKQRRLHKKISKEKEKLKKLQSECDDFTPLP